MRAEAIDTEESCVVPVAEIVDHQEMVEVQPEQQLGEVHRKKPRVLSVDMLRGLTMALMILANNPGDWGHVFPQLDHATWNGWTLTDLIFPSFLLLMGVAMVFSLASRATKSRGSMARHIFSRAGRLMLLALVLSFFPRMDWHSLRYFGVLPRIAACFLLAGLILLFTRRMRALAAIVAVLLVGYWALLRFTALPHHGQPGTWMPFLDPVDNLAAHVDRIVVGFTQHWLHTGVLFDHTSDPEGVVSTLGALATTLIGAMCGVWMRRSTVKQMRLGLLVAGAALVAAGEVWSIWYPINKSLWTGTYALLSAGFCMLALGVCSLLVDGHAGRWPNWLRWTTWPWFVFGSNAIVAYVFSEAFVKAMIFVRIADADGDLHTLWTRIYEGVFARQQSTEWTSLAFAFCYVCFCFLPCWALWHKKIFVKI
ncbi:MAG: heparan-alpha-glucosaminide N-acetyltransferase domain-containing protein [Acidobacteriaceae bacterium]|nr:heparan-alpha-glucosaminide N-acetyltransferase domain-containing protein [Acidobacteriaceae bacterium]